MNLQYPYSTITSGKSLAHSYFLLSLQAAGEISTILEARYKEKLPPFEVAPCAFYSDYTKGFQMKCSAANSSGYISGYIIELGAYPRLDLSVGSIFYEVGYLTLYEIIYCGRNTIDYIELEGLTSDMEDEIVEAFSSLQEQATSLLIAKMKEEVDSDVYDPFAEE